MKLTIEIIKEALEALGNLNHLNPNSKFLIYEDNLRVLHYSFKNRNLDIQEVYTHNPQVWYDEPIFEHDLTRIEFYPSYEEYIDKTANEIFDLYCHYLYYIDKQLEEELKQKINSSINPNEFRLAYHNTILLCVNTHPDELEILNKSHIRDNIIELVENDFKEVEQAELRSA